ncbi:microtubule-associated protein futsch-like isoform X2 [Heptranchias perlo]|uniref:microtubule-associated protein futsch-like isoform X2 n=1 Tax=Heptranchias perlo TaxID=212740 RepID=UPI003559C83B
MGNESSSMGDQPKATDTDTITSLPPNRDTAQDTSKVHKKKKGSLSGARSSKYGKNEQNVNEELPGLKSTGTASDQAQTSHTHPAPGLQGDNIAAPTAQSVSLDSESIPADLQVKQCDFIQAAAGPVVPGPKTGDNNVQSPETITENNLNSTSQEILVGQKDASPECKEKENLQITADSKSPFLAENKNSLWSLLEDAAFEGDALKVNNIFDETKTTAAEDTGHSLKASSLAVQGNTATSAAEERLSDLLHHGEQLDETDEQGSNPSLQGTDGGDQLPAQETKCGRVLPVPGCKESIIEENPAKSTDGTSDLLMVEIQDLKYLTPVSLEKHAEYVAIASHDVVSHSQVKLENEQFSEEVVTDQEENCILPKVDLKEIEGFISVTEYARNLSEGVVLEGNELSLSCNIDQHQTSHSENKTKGCEENECSLLMGTENQRCPAKMELLPIGASDLDTAKLNVTLLAVSDEQQKTHNTNEQENISKENVCSLVTRMENIPETAVLTSIHQNPSTGRTKENLMGFSCDYEQGQMCNQETKNNVCEGDLGSLEMHMENIVFPVNPQNLDALEPKETAFVFKSEQQMCTSESKGKVCEENVWNLQTNIDSQETTKPAPSYQNTYAEKARNEPLGFCCDSNQQASSGEEQAKVSEGNLSSVQIDSENCSFQETSDLTLCQNLNLLQMKEMLLGFQNDQQVCSTEKQDSRSEKIGCTLQTGLENGLLSDRMGLSSSSQDPDSMEMKGEQLNLNVPNEQQEDTSEIQNEVCEEGLSEEGLSCLQKDVGIENKIFLETFELTPSSQTPDTMVVKEISVLSTEQQQSGNSMTKENVCEGNVCSLHTVHVELSPSSQIPGTVKPKEALLSVTNKWQACSSEKKEMASKENQCDLQTRLESSIFPESRELLLNLQNCDSKEATKEKLSDFSHYMGQISTCTTETLCQDNLSNIQMIKNIIIPAAMQLPAILDFPGTAEVKESLMSVNSEQICSSEKQEKVSEENVCNSPATMESTLFSETVDLPLVPQNIGSTGTENEQSCLSHSSVQQTAQGEMKENLGKEEVCSFQSDQQDTISERVESLLASQQTAGTEMKEALLTFSGEQLQTSGSEEQQKDYEGNVCRLQEGPEDTVLSTSTELALNPQDATTKEETSEGLTHEQQQMCDTESKEGVYKEDSDSLQMPVENILIPEATKLTLCMQNPDAVEHRDLLMRLSNKQQQAGSEIAKEKDCEENIQKPQTDTEKIIATSMDLPPSSEIPSIDELTETLFSHRELQKCDREKQEKLSEDNLYNFPIGTETSLFQHTKELSPTTQNIGSIATENEQLPLSYDTELETAHGEIEENLSKEEVYSFQTDREDMIPERAELLPASQQTVDIGMKEALLTFSGEHLETSGSKEQQKDYEGNVCRLQEGPEDTVLSTSTELALNPQDASTKEETSEGFTHEQQQMCDTESKEGVYKEDSDSPQMPVENILILEATKLTLCMQNPDAVEHRDLLMRLSNKQQQAGSEIAKEKDCEENIQKPQTDTEKIIATSMDLPPSSEIPSIDELTETLFSHRELQKCASEKQEKLSEDNLYNFPIGTETSLFQHTKELSPITQNIGSIATENEQLPLSYEQETAHEEIEENLSKEEVCSFQTDREDMIPERAELLPASQQTADTGMKEALLTFSGEHLQTSGSKEQQKDYEGNVCRLQEGPEDTVLSTSTELALNPQDATTNEETSEGFTHEQQQMCDTESKEGVYKEDSDSLQMPVENILIPEATKLTLCMQNPDAVEHRDLLMRLSNKQQQAGSEIAKEKDCEENIQKPQTDTEKIIATSMDLPPSSEIPSIDELTETLFSHRELQKCDREKQEKLSEDNLYNFPIGTETSLFQHTKELSPITQNIGSIATENEQLPLSYDTELETAHGEIEENLSKEEVCSFQTDREDMIPERAELLPASQQTADTGMKEALLTFSGEQLQTSGSKEQQKDYEGNVCRLQKGPEDTVLSTSTELALNPQDATTKEETSEGFTHEQQQMCDTESKEGVYKEDSDSPQMPVENILILEATKLTLCMQNPDAVEHRDLLMRLSNKQQQAGSEIAKEKDCEENIQKPQTDTEKIIATSMDLPPSSEIPSIDELTDTLFSHRELQKCASEKQEKLSEDNLYNFPIGTETSLFQHTKELSPITQNIGSIATENEQLPLSYEQETAHEEIEENLSKEEVCSFQTDREDMIPERAELLPASQQTADTGMKEALLTFSGEHLQTSGSKEQQKDYEGNVCRLQEGPEDTVLSTSTELALNPQDATTKEETSEGFTHEQQQMCDTESKEGVYKEDSDSSQMPVENILIPEATKLTLCMQNPDAVEHRDLLMRLSNKQQQAGSKIAKEKDCEENIQKPQTDTEKIIATSMDLPPSSEIPSIDELTETLFSHRELQKCASEKQEKLSEDNLYNFPIGTETSLFQHTKELSPTTQNIGSIATENEQLPLSYDTELETAHGEIEENLSKEEVCSFQTDREGMIPERAELLPASQQTADTGMKEALLTFSGEHLQTSGSKEQQKDYVCRLQEGPEDTVLSTSTELALNPQDATTKEETSEGFSSSTEKQQMCDSELTHGLCKKNLNNSQISVENIFPPEATKLSLGTEKPDVEEQSHILLGFNRQRADSEIKEKVCEANEQNLQNEAGTMSTSEVLKSPASCQDPATTKLKETIIGFSREHQQIDNNGKQEVTEVNLCCFHTATESTENILTPKVMEMAKVLQDPSTNEMKEELLGFGIDRKQQQMATRRIEDNYYEENVGCLQHGEKNIPEPAATECTAQYPNTETLKERLMNFNHDVEHQKTCGNATKANTCAESMSSFQVGMKTTLPESITLIQSAPISQALEDNGTLLGVSDQQQQICSSLTEEKIYVDNVCSLLTVIENVTAELLAGSGNHHIEEAKENTLGFSCENDQQETCSDEMKEKICEENVHSFQLDTADTLPETIELIPATVSHCTAEVKEALPGFISEQQMCINEANANVCEENLCRLQMGNDSIVLPEVIELTPGSQSPETSKETLLAVVSEQLKTGISVMKDNISEDNMWSLQTGNEHIVPVGTMELTANLQNHDEEKGKETLLGISGDLEQELILKNESKENLHEDNMQVSKTSTEDVKLSVNEELTACTQDCNIAGLPENTMGFSGKQQAESMDSLQVSSENNLFPEAIKLIPGTQIPDTKDVKEILVLSSEHQQQMCNSVIKKEEAYGKTAHILQSTVENITIPESMKLASTPQDSDNSELMAFSNEQQQTCSSGMKTETSKEDDYIENNLYPDTTMILPFSPLKEDKVDFREKLSDVSWNTEQQNWNIEVQDNISEKNMFKLKTNTEITTPLEAIKFPSNLQIHELENGKDYLLASSRDADKSQISSIEPKEKVVEENANSLKLGGEGIILEASKLTPRLQDPEAVELKGTALDFEKEQQQTCNSESKETRNLLSDTENISAEETMELPASSQKFDTEKDEDKLLDFSHDTEQQQTCNDESKEKFFKENACIEKMDIANSVLPETTKLLSSSDIATELQETTNSSSSEAQQISTAETKENFCVENIHSLENIIPESNGLTSSSLHSDAIIKEDILSRIYDNEKQQTLNMSGEESVYANGVGSLKKGMTFGIDPEVEFALCCLSVPEAVEINQLATTSDSEQQQTYDNLISHSICEEKVSLEMDFALQSDKLPEAAGKETISVRGTDYKIHAVSETQLTKSMTTKSKEPSSATEHLLLLHTRDATESCLEIDVKKQENTMGVLPTGNFAEIDQTSIEKQSCMSDTEFGNEFLFAIEQTARPKGRSPHSFADVKEEEFLLAACENTEVRIIEKELKEGLKTKSPSPESASSSPSALGKDAVGVICTITTGALDEGIITTSVSLASEKEESVPSHLLAPVTPHPPQHSEYTKLLYEAEVVQNHLEQIPLSASSSCEEQEDFPHPLFSVTPQSVPAEAVQESSEQTINSTSVPCDIKDTVCPTLLSDLPLTSSLQKDAIVLQDDAEQFVLSVSVPCDCGELVDPLLPSAPLSFSPLQFDDIDELPTDTTQLQNELNNTVNSDIAESIPPSPPPLCSDTDTVGVEQVLISVSDCDEPVVPPLLPAPPSLPPLQSDAIDKPIVDITSLQNQLVSVSVSCDCEEPIAPPLQSAPRPLSPEGINKPQVDTTDLQELVRSSDSEGAFETPEETTPVKVPPLISPAAAEKDSQEQLPSEDSVFFPDNRIVDAPENSLQETDSFRPLSESASIVFDEDKPIASSGAYKIDFDSLDVLESFQAPSSLDPSSPVKSEGSEICGQASEKSLYSTSSFSPPPSQSPPFTRKSDGTTDVSSTEAVAKTLQAEAFSIASDNAPSVKKKKPRPLSLKKKTKSEKPAETQADKLTETPTATETQARPAVPETNKEVTISESSCNNLQSVINQQDSPVSLLASCSFEPDNFAELNPFASGDKLQNLPVAQSESETVSVVLKESEKIAPETGTVSDSPAVGHAVRLEFDYSEDNDSFETEQEKKPPPKKFGKKSGGKMPLRKPKIGIKKVPTVDKVDSALATPSYSTADPDDIPIPKTTYSFDPAKWDDPNFNPFGTNVQVPNSPKLPHASSSFDMDKCDNSVDPFKSSTKIPGSPSHSPASFEVNDDTGASEGDINNKSSKKKRPPLKTNTFRVKRSPKRTSLSEASSQDSTPLTTPETPPVIGTVEHATDEEKLASSVTNQKWSYSGIQTELEEDKPDYPQPSDLSAFVNENSEFVNENFSSAVLGYEQSLEIEYMEKLGSSPHHDTNATKQPMYLKIDSLKDSPVKCPPIRLSDSTTPCSGSSSDDGVSSAAIKLSVTRTLAPSQEAHLQSPDKLKDMDSLSSTPAKSDLATPEESIASADVLLSRIVGHTDVDDELDYLKPDAAEKNPSAFAYKLQEELVYAAMRIEALKLARQLSNSPCSTLDYEQRDNIPSMDTPITKAALYSRTGDSEADDTPVDGHHYNQRDLDSALRAAREEIVAKEREAAEWQSKFDESRQEVVEMRRIVAEYEKTIAQMIEDDQREKSISHHTVQQLILEKDQALSDLNSVEKSLADLFRRYEKMKEVLEGFRKNEEVLKKCAQEYLARVKKEEQRYHALKVHAEEKLDKANAEIAQVRSKSKSEQTAFQASLRKEQMKVESLERTLEQKNKEVEELTKICDELIAKMGKS